MEAEDLIGKSISMIDGTSVKVEELLGEGGQGAVYKVKTEDGSAKALKWYTNVDIIDNSDFYSNIVKLSETTIYNKEMFLWPELVTLRQHDSYGYLMDLRPANFKEFGDFFCAREYFHSFTARVNASINICKSFLSLHRSGFSYQDLNEGNIFIDPETGDVLICDNDNVAPNGVSSGVSGKARYIAPEVLDKKNGPNISSDRFSLAILLYRIFMVDHPFEGQTQLKYPCMTEDIEKSVYGRDAIFVFDDKNVGNRPCNIQKNHNKFWNFCPDSLKRMFKDALSHDAIIDPSKRKHEKEWIELLMQLRANLIVCPHSSKEKDHDFLSDGNVKECPLCHKQISHTDIVELHSKSCAYPYLISRHKYLYVEDSKVGYSQIRKTESRVDVGLRNLTATKWAVTTASGKTVELGPNEIMPLRNCMEINMGPRGKYVVKIK